MLTSPLVQAIASGSLSLTGITSSALSTISGKFLGRNTQACFRRAFSRLPATCRLGLVLGRIPEQSWTANRCFGKSRDVIKKGAFLFYLLTFTAYVSLYFHNTVSLVIVCMQLRNIKIVALFSSLYAFVNRIRSKWRCSPRKTWCDRQLGPFKSYVGWWGNTPVRTFGLSTGNVGYFWYLTKVNSKLFL